MPPKCVAVNRFNEAIAGGVRAVPGKNRDLGYGRWVRKWETFWGITASNMKRSIPQGAMISYTLLAVVIFYCPFRLFLQVGQLTLQFEIILKG
jgi:hypothetical protein